MSDRSDFNDLAIAAGGDAVMEAIGQAIAARDDAPQKPVAAKVPDRNAEAWPDPILPGVRAAPEISPHLLPGVFGEFAAALAASTQTPPEMATMFVISVLSSVLQGRFEVAPKNNSYREPLPIWTCTCFPSGGRKTAIFTAAMAPIQRWEKLASDRLRREVMRRIAAREVALKRIERLKNDAAKVSDSDERVLIQNMIQLELETMPEEMKLPRVFTTNATPESTERMLTEQCGKMAILSDESDTLLNLSGGLRGGIASLDVVLKGHAGSAIRVDRQGREAHLDRPCLSMGLMVQPDTFAVLAAGQRMRSTGLLARFLYAVPKSNIGRRPVREDVPIPQAVEDGYNDSIMDLMQGYEDRGATVRVLPFDDEAKEMWLTFAEEIEANQGEGGSLETISDWSGKLPGQAARLAAIFQIAESGLRVTEVGPAAVARALTLCNLLICHAEAAFSKLGADDADNDALAVLRWIKAGERDEFKRREAQRAMHSRFTKVERLEQALSVLRDSYLISGEKKATTGGRASAFYLVNPKLYEAKEKR